MTEKESISSKRVSDSSINYYPYEIFPHDLNSHKTVFGGRVLEVADKLSEIISRRHSQRVCLTLFLDSVHFLCTAKEADIMVFKGAVNRVWRTSMEIGIKVFIEDALNQENRHMASMYFTCVGVDQDNRPVSIPQVIPETKDEIRRFKEAGVRRKRRIRLSASHKIS